MKYEELKSAGWAEDVDGTIYGVVWAEEKRSLVWRMRAPGQTWEQAAEAYEMISPDSRLVYPGDPSIEQWKPAEPPPPAVVRLLDITNEKRQRETHNFFWGCYTCKPMTELLKNQLRSTTATMLSMGCPAEDIATIVGAEVAAHRVKAFVENDLRKLGDDLSGVTQAIEQVTAGILSAKKVGGQP